jgi:hypothetical protein
MPGKPAACDGNGIEAHFTRAQPGPLREEMLGCSGDACLLTRHQGFHGVDKRIARLDFNEADYPSRRARDEIDLPKTGANPTAKNSIALGEQNEARQQLAAPAAPLRGRLCRPVGGRAFASFGNRLACKCALIGFATRHLERIRDQIGRRAHRHKHER